MKLVYRTLESPIGPLLILGDETGALRSIEFPREEDGSRPPVRPARRSALPSRSDVHGPTGSDRLRRRPAPVPVDAEADTKDLLSEVIRQLTEYFDGERKTFQLRLAPAGTDRYSQPVRFVASVSQPSGCAITVTRGADTRAELVELRAECEPGEGVDVIFTVRGARVGGA